jgi:hypothetical protein
MYRDTGSMTVQDGQFKGWTLSEISQVSSRKKVFMFNQQMAS